jgi:outer membrane protein assembly factor BamB
VQSEDGYYRTSGVYSWSNVYAFNATNGTTIWDYRQNWSDGGSTPAVVNGVVFLGLSDYVAALNASDGASLWNFTAEVSSSPTVVDGIVYVGAYNSGNLYALNATNGDSIWNYTIGGIALSSPLLFSTA